MNLLVAYILICVAAIIIGYLVVRKFMNPITVFVFVWLTIVLLYQLQLSKLQHPISDQTYITLIVCVVFFVIFFLFVYNIMTIIAITRKIRNRKKLASNGSLGAQGDAVKRSIQVIDKSENGKINFRTKKKEKKMNPHNRVDIMLPKSHSTIKKKEKNILISRGKMITDIIASKDMEKASHDNHNNELLVKNRNSVKSRAKVVLESIASEQMNEQVIIDAPDLHEGRQKKITEKKSIANSKKKVEFKHSEHKPEIKKKKKMVTFKLILCLFAVWFVIECIEVVYSGGIPILWKVMHVNKSYFDFGITSLHGLMNAFGLVIITMSAYLYEVTRKNEKKRNFWLWAIIGVMLGFYGIILTRQVMISAILQIIVIKLLFISKKDWRKVVIGGTIFAVVGVSAFGILGNVRTGYQDFLRVSYMKDDWGEWASGLQWVYMYLTMTIANINEVVELGINDLGLGAILPQRMPSVLDGLYSNDAKSIRHLIVDSYNVSGFFNDYYLGFGNEGVAAISAFYGLLGGYFFFRFRDKRNAKYMIYYAIYIQFVLLSFFTDYLIFLADGSQFIIVYLIFKFSEIPLVRKNKSVKNKSVKNNVKKNNIGAKHEKKVLMRGKPANNVFN